jgi:hypothetical protein
VANACVARFGSVSSFYSEDPNVMGWWDGRGRGIVFCDAGTGSGWRGTAFPFGSSSHLNIIVVV